MGHQVKLEVDVIESDIPLLLSKKAMKKAGMSIDLKDDTVTVFGRREKLLTTSNGHYCLLLLDRTDKAIEQSVGLILAVDLESLSEGEQFKAIVKLLKQFGHAPKEKFITFMKDAKAWNKNLLKHLDRVTESCEGCIMRMRNLDKPVVSFPMAQSFNEKVAIDLKHWNGKYILHMVDMYS